MSESARTEANVKEEQVKNDKQTASSTDSDPDPYCCTPADGDGGPDTKP
jgi:hypothetical protein